MPARSVLSFAIAVSLTPAAIGAEKPKPAAAPAITSETFQGLALRNIGPAIMGGRIDKLMLENGMGRLEAEKKVE